MLDLLYLLWTIAAAIYIHYQACQRRLLATAYNAVLDRFTYWQARCAASEDIVRQYWDLYTQAQERANDLQERLNCIEDLERR